MLTRIDAKYVAFLHTHLLDERKINRPLYWKLLFCIFQSHWCWIIMYFLDTGNSTGSSDVDLTEVWQVRMREVIYSCWDITVSSWSSFHNHKPPQLSPPPPSPGARQNKRGHQARGLTATLCMQNEMAAIKSCFGFERTHQHGRHSYFTKLRGGDRWEQQGLTKSPKE